MKTFLENRTAVKRTVKENRGRADMDKWRTYSSFKSRSVALLQSLPKSLPTPNGMTFFIWGSLLPVPHSVKACVTLGCIYYSHMNKIYFINEALKMNEQMKQNKDNILALRVLFFSQNNHDKLGKDHTQKNTEGNSLVVQVVRTPCFHCRGHEFDPWSEN